MATIFIFLLSNLSRAKKHKNRDRTIYYTILNRTYDATSQQRGMSGRPYARHDDGSRGSATDIIAMHPHTFQIRLCASERSRSIAIRCIMARRRRKETNWRKLLIMRHTKSEAELSVASDQCTGDESKESVDIKMENPGKITDYRGAKECGDEHDKSKERLAVNKLTTVI